METRILLVEDNRPLRSTLGVFLELLDCAVCGSTDSGEEALDRIKREPPDLLMTDYVLPEINGAELCARAKKICPGLKCLLISGFADPELVAKARKAGASGFVLKGDPQMIEKGIQSALNGEPFFCLPESLDPSRSTAGEPL